VGQVPLFDSKKSQGATGREPTKQHSSKTTSNQTIFFFEWFIPLPVAVPLKTSLLTNASTLRLLGDLLD